VDGFAVPDIPPGVHRRTRPAPVIRADLVARWAAFDLLPADEQARIDAGRYVPTRETRRLLERVTGRDWRPLIGDPQPRRTSDPRWIA
jgi:hypothetical protein